MARPSNVHSISIDSGHEGGLPLYVRVRSVICDRIRSGVWRPGQMIPSELEIGRELGVSQGTIRKVLDGLARELLVVRRQGRGTFVVEHTPEDVLFRFFQIYRNDGSRIAPESIGAKAQIGDADEEERTRLTLPRSARVIRIGRIRTYQDRPIIAERIVLPHALFPGLAKRPEIPNTIYDMFQHDFGILVVRADERITAVAAKRRCAWELGIAPTTPLLRIDRIAYTIDDRAVEWRVSFVHLEAAHYLARLR